MHITTTARHCELGTDDRRFVEQRIEKLGRIARDLTEVHVTVTAEKYRHAAEIAVKLKRQELVSRQEADDLRAAVDQAVERMEHQIRRYKERRDDRKKLGGRARATDGPTDGVSDGATDGATDGAAAEATEGEDDYESDGR